MKKITVIAIVLAIVLFFATIIGIGFIWTEGKNTPAYWCREEVFALYVWRYEKEIFAYKIEPLSVVVDDEVLESNGSYKIGLKAFKITVYADDYEIGFVEYIASIGYKRPKGAGMFFNEDLISAEDIVDLDIIEFAEVVAVDEWY